MSNILMCGTEPIGQVAGLTADNVEYSEGVSVKDKIDNLPLNAWGILYNRNVYSASETELTTELNRSITKYPLLAFTFVKGGIARDSILIPSDLFASGTNVDLSYVGGASDRHSITISYYSDSSVKVSADQNNGDYKLFAYALAPSTTF